MASISTDKSGNRTIQFVRGDGSRTSIRLGKVPLQHVRKVKLHVEALSAAKRAAVAFDDRTADWLRGIDDDLHKKLVAVGLVAPRIVAVPEPEPEVPRLGASIAGYIVMRADLKPRSVSLLRQMEKSMVAYFGSDKTLASITPGDADDWRRRLRTPKGKGGGGLAENTVRRRCGLAKQMFRAALRHKLIAENPFADMKDLKVMANHSRDYFVMREEAAAVLDACPNSEWRLIFAPSRYGGLRCPSEHLELRWGDIDWERDTLVVRSPKTERHPGGEQRITPLFWELRPHLEAAWDEAEEGAEFVIARCRDSGTNLRSRLCTIIRHAGIEPWSKPFQNCRATRATELADEFPSHVAAKWLGHSTVIADKHYRQVTEQHHAKAVQKAVQQLTATNGSGKHTRGSAR